MCARTCAHAQHARRTPSQIHLLPDGTIHIFSRSSEDNTSKYPDLVSSLPRAFQPDVQSFILDAEAVAYDRKAARFLPFQVLSTRARKDVKSEDVTVNVIVMGFDLLYLNGEVGAGRRARARARSRRAHAGPTCPFRSRCCRSRCVAAASC